MAVLKGAMASIFGDQSRIDDPAPWLTNMALRGGTSPSGVSVSHPRLLGLSTYYDCIRAIAEDIAKVPITVVRDISDTKREPVRDHEIVRLLNTNRGRTWSGRHIREMLLQWAMGWGNGYAFISRVNDVVDDLILIHPSRVEVIEDDGDGAILYRIHDKFLPRVLDPSNVLHIRNPIGDELRGFSVAEVGAMTLGKTVATEQYAARFFKEGAIHSGAITTDKALSDKARQQIMRTWPKGLPNVHRPLVLDNGLQFTPFDINPENAQMIESLNQQGVDITRWFRIQPHKVGHLEHATFSNISEQKLEYHDDTLMPWYVRAETEFDRKLLNPNETDLHVKHVLTALLRGDPERRSRFYERMVRIGAFSVNQVLAKEDMNDIGPPGDIHFVEVNRAPIDAFTGGNVPGAQDNGNGTQQAARAVMPVLTDAIGRLQRAEDNLFKRYSRKPAKDFEAWKDKYLFDHRDAVVERVGPCVQTFCVASGIDISGSDVVLKWADGYVDALREHWDAGVTDRNGWQGDQAVALLDAILEAGDALQE